MPQSLDLLGAGVPPLVAGMLGNDPAALTTTGTTQATAALIKGHLVTLTTAGSQTGAILPSNAKIGTPYWVFNSTATTGIVYAPVTGTPATTMNGGASTSGVNVAQNKLACFIQVSLGNWASILTA